MSFIKNRVAIGNKYFYTHEISELATAGLMRFGRRLGDYGTYNRVFRKLREDGYYPVGADCRDDDEFTFNAKWKTENLKTGNVRELREFQNKLKNLIN